MFEEHEKVNLTTAVGNQEKSNMKWEVRRPEDSLLVDHGVEFGFCPQCGRKPLNRLKQEDNLT